MSTPISKWLMRYSGIVALVLAVLTLSFSVSARDLDQDEVLRLRQEGRIPPLEQLLHPALARYPGAKLLEAELEEEDDVLVYEIELLTTDGVVRELEIDVRDGRILKDKEDD
ncbi:MAG: PepSY domain-containing protein [Pseudomonas sp.]|uniref:PepSY domain-containing protein n=1 Tax=Pseudomonas sp. TaxID=306 RepID=UPI0030F0CA83